MDTRVDKHLRQAQQRLQQALPLRRARHSGAVRAVHQQAGRLSGGRAGRWPLAAPEGARQARLCGDRRTPALHRLASSSSLSCQQLAALLSLLDATLHCSGGSPQAFGRVQKRRYWCTAGRRQPGSACLGAERRRGCCLRSPPSASSCRPSFCKLRSAASRAPRARLAPSRRRRSSEAALQQGEEQGGGAGGAASPAPRNAPRRRRREGSWGECKTRGS